jgi:hypothetical protein
MVHVTIEHMIMIPILILQIFLFPLATNVLMNVWVDSRRTLAIQDVASHLGSAIQQLYFALNHETISAGKTTYSAGLPPYIEDYPYFANATLRAALGPPLNSSQILEITLTLIPTKITATSSAVLGSNVLWQPSTYKSNSTHACVTAEKFADGTISMYFGE